MNKEEIKELRLRLKMSQQAFATKLGVGIATVSRWELGIFKPSPLAENNLQKLKDIEWKI
jgi:DNA-binding transcriptional regulator YiaG